MSSTKNLILIKTIICSCWAFVIGLLWTNFTHLLVVERSSLIYFMPKLASLQVFSIINK
jgi:hypothetical protein